MSLNVAEIRSLLRRAHQSARRGYQIALGEEYAQKLNGTDGSPTGLIDLCRQALADHAEPVAAPVDADDSAPPTWIPPAPEAEPPVQAEDATVDEPAEDIVDGETEEGVEEAAETESADVAKDPAPGAASVKRGSRRRARK